MKLKEEFIRLPKEIVYDMYESLVYDIKDYDKVTRGKMLDDIIAEYELEDYLYNICTEKELQFLKYIQNNKLTKTDIKKYKWEIEELNTKGIFSSVTYEIFAEQKKNVEKALKTYQNNKIKKQNMENIVIIMISLVKINTEMLVNVVKGFITSLTSISEEAIEALLGHPLIHFYCGIYKRNFEFSHKQEEVIFYRRYWGLLDEYDERKKQFGIAGTTEVNFQDYFDIFYYGFPINKKKVKRMYDEISKLKQKDFLLEVIEEVRVLNDRNILPLIIKDKQLLQLTEEALDETPCSVMNGFTPLQHKKEKQKNQEVQVKFDMIPQNNAHLPKKGADKYYKLYFALLDYVNQKKQISKKLGHIYKQEGLDIKEVQKIDTYLWEHKEIIDDFVHENKHNFSQEELNQILLFKGAISSEHFIVVGFEREYTKILSEDGKIYMVKGIRCNLDKIMDKKQIPMIIRTTLLMFQGVIIFNSFYSSIDLTIGSDMKQLIFEDCEKAIKYYHL